MREITAPAREGRDVPLGKGCVSLGKGCVSLGKGCVAGVSLGKGHVSDDISIHV